MSDERLRTLERRWRETGSPHDEAAWLSERVRVGALDVERLRLAAALGHDASLALLGDDAPAPAPHAPCELISSLKPLGPAAFNRAAIVALRLLDPEPAEVVAALSAWLGCPCEGCARGVRRAAREAQLGEWSPTQVGGALLAVRLAGARPARAPLCTPMKDDGGRTIGWRCRHRQRRRRYESVARDAVHLREAIAGNLMRWCLG